jgi:hypothetical protein
MSHLRSEVMEQVEGMQSKQEAQSLLVLGALWEGWSRGREVSEEWMQRRVAGLAAGGAGSASSAEGGPSFITDPDAGFAEEEAQEALELEQEEVLQQQKAAASGGAAAGAKGSPGGGSGSKGSGAAAAAAAGGGSGRSSLHSSAAKRPCTAPLHALVEVAVCSADGSAPSGSSGASRSKRDERGFVWFALQAEPAHELAAAAGAGAGSSAAQQLQQLRFSSLPGELLAHVNTQQTRKGQQAQAAALRVRLSAAAATASSAAVPVLEEVLPVSWDVLAASLGSTAR